MGLFNRSKNTAAAQSTRSLIIAGPSCSGCALTASLLNSHPRISTSYERFAENSEQAIGALSSRPIDSLPSSSNPNWTDADTNRFLNSFDEAEVIGDAAPLHEKSLATLAANLPNARILGLNRSVYALAAAYERRRESDDYPDWIDGYQKAVGDWNRAQVSLLDISRTQPEKTLIISYERLYSYSPIYLKNILTFLEVGSESPQILSAYEKMCADWMYKYSQQDVSAEIHKYIQQHANFEAYQLAIEFGEKSFS